MKKRIFAIALAVALIAIAVGGTLAYFNDTDTATNVFTVGEIDITQHEHEYDENGDLQDFTQDQVLMPVVDPQAPAADPNYVQKLVSVENEGKSDAYVRTFLAVPAALQDILILDTVTGTTNWVEDSKTWPNVTVDGVEYAVISYTYNAVLSQGDVTDHVLKGVYLDARVDLQENADGVKQFCTLNTDGTYTFYDFDITETTQIHVLVATQGCQADGFTNGAADALDTVFPAAPDFS